MVSGSGSTSNAGFAHYAWIGGILYVVALIAEGVISLGFKISQSRRRVPATSTATVP